MAARKARESEGLSVWGGYCAVSGMFFAWVVDFVDFGRWNVIPTPVILNGGGIYKNQRHNIKDIAPPIFGVYRNRR